MWVNVMFCLIGPTLRRFNNKDYGITPKRSETRQLKIPQDIVVTNIEGINCMTRL